VKFLLVPLLIIGMFVSFAAALVAMLFFTKTVESPQQLMGFLLGNKDSTDMFEEFHLKEDRLSELVVLTEEYKTRYEALSLKAEAKEESLAVASVKLQVTADSLDDEKQKMGLTADTLVQRQRKERLQELAKFYDKIKAQRAAEILQQETELADTTVATLMQMLQPQQMAKIMGFMNPDFAARVTKIMKELPR
jgi:flagellar motility protein MotE (MotC chaperone)